MKVVTAEQMQQIDQECSNAGLPTRVLMENAGLAVAEEVKQILGTSEQQHILILVGPGNNGGDGLVAARHLHDWGAKVSLYLFGQRKAEDLNLKLVQQPDITIAEAVEDEKLERLDDLLSSTTDVIDAIFGTGISRPLDDNIVRVLGRVSEARERQTGLRIIALDLPSGLNTDTGEADPDCLYADYTITLGFPKLGLYSVSGAERAGKITVADIGIPTHLVEHITTEVITDDWVRSVLPRRPLGANKGSFGRVLVVAGSINYIGAAYLACSGAMRAGAGLVTLATAARLQPILASKLTEVTYLPLPESRPGIIAPPAARLIHRELDHYDVLLLGCGLGLNQFTIRFVRSVLFRLKEGTTSLVLDADALNMLAQTPDWWQQMDSDAILTPHPGEMARLARVAVNEVQADRVAITRDMAAEWHKTVVLKGAYTVVATPDTITRINPIANPGLASAGTGDVLSGIIAGLVAQGLTLADAAACGVYLHGKAGELVKSQMGDAGMMATDILPALPLVIKQIKG